MLAQIRNAGKAVTTLMVLGYAATLVSCATHRNVALVDDPNGTQQSSIPWNKQEKWENTGPLSGLTDRR